ncbi:MAG: HAD family phosphatase [Acidimicrobiaceae bacterium]|nr:HAD family phosphatase [Acidimicrobiaceae bacterium]
MSGAPSAAIRLLVSDVDGTLLTPDKTLTNDAIRAVAALGDAGVHFALTSARPPQGLEMLIEPLGVNSPLGALNGALIVDTQMRVLEERTIDDHLTAPIIDLLHDHQLSVWVYQGSQWFVLDENGPHIEHESRGCGCRPTKLSDFRSVEGGITKVVGVSDDASHGAAASTAMGTTFGSQVSATRSQTYFLDVTHPDANKGRVVRFLAELYGVASEEIATIGDMHNDVSMFAESGLSIAMGNADDAVKAAASKVSRSNDDEGFAYAVERFVLNL